MVCIFCVLLIHCQVLIEITEASSVITWDFDVCKGDAVFNIYHSRKAPQTQKRDTLGNLTGPGGNNMQVIEKAWILGKDYSLVETALTCREGESIQVTTDVTSHALIFSYSQCFNNANASQCLNKLVLSPFLNYCPCVSFSVGLSCNTLAWFIHIAVVLPQLSI